MDQRIIDLYDDYVHVHFDRRLFLDRAAKLVGSGSAAAALLPLLQSNYALAATVAENDPALTTQRVTVPGATGDLKAYLAEPKGGAKRGDVLIAHQNRGLNAHIEDIARRLAKEGYNALAVDFLSPLGGTPADENVAMQMFGKLDAVKTDANAVAALKWLRARPESNGKTAIIGFCWGGGVANDVATMDPQLSVAVVYYGVPPKADTIKNIKAPMLLNYADPTIDTRLGMLAPDYDKELTAAGVKHELFFYKGANHAFNDDTNQERYNPEAAKESWARSLAYLKKNLT